ncbi:unnamed protein product, partial [Mesorhabditis belari]|uniref:phosphatidylserine decarboxylase n=1 Tax=Mesorhabditis belari TaxID=2138241 RepID=A0AAF3FD27_9BILA
MQIDIPLIDAHLNNYSIFALGLVFTPMFYFFAPSVWKFLFGSGGVIQESIYLMFPSLSVPYTHLAGKIANIQLPVFIRSFIYSIYIWYHGINMKEAANEDLKSYKSLQALFTRPLKPGMRPIDDCTLVSPVDGVVIEFGEISDDRKIQQIKSHTYEFEEFLGPIDPKHKANNKLYEVVIYLRATDYHCYHSPTKWETHTKVEHAGHILPFKLHKFIPQWFSINARVALIGKWKYGFFSMTPVAATTVGDIHINPEFERTPPKKLESKHDHYAKYTMYEQVLSYKPGDKVGHFEAGSECVLIFEAPPHLKFDVKKGQLIHYGNRLLSVDPESPDDSEMIVSSKFDDFNPYRALDAE